MARPVEPKIGTPERLELDRSRYLRVYRVVRDLILQGSSKHDAYIAAASRLSTVRKPMPYDTVKKHFIRMSKSAEAAEAAGINVDELPEWTEADAEDPRDRRPLHLDRESARQLQEMSFWEEASADPITFAFSETERRQLRSKGVSKKFANQLARERLELIALRKLTGRSHD